MILEETNIQDDTAPPIGGMLRAALAFQLSEKVAEKIAEKKRQVEKQETVNK